VGGEGGKIVERGEGGRGGGGGGRWYGEGRVEGGRGVGSGKVGQEEG